MRNVATRSEYQRILNEHLAKPNAVAELSRHLGIKSQAVSKWRQGHGPGHQYQGPVADYFNDDRLRERTPDPPAALPGELRRELRDALQRALDVLNQMDD